MRRWIVALLAVAFFAAGPALAGGKAGGMCGGKKRCATSSQQMSAGGCSHVMKGAGCGQQEARCVSITKSGCGKGAAGCASMMQSGCGKQGMACGSMGSCGGPCGGRAMHISHDPSNIWYRGPAPRATVADWMCEGGRCDGPRGMSCREMPRCGERAMGSCREEMGACSERMECSQTAWKAAAGTKCDTGCPHARGRTAWKSGCGVEVCAPKAGCCSKGGEPKR
jgi:hypothetical protein